MDFTEGVYDSADYPDGLYIYEIGDITDDPPDHILIEGIFRYDIQDPDGEGMIACFETRESFRRTRSIFLDENGDLRPVTQTATLNFLAGKQSDYGVEYAAFEQRTTELTTIKALEGLGSVD